MMAVNDISGLMLKFSDAIKFVTTTGTKHEAKGYKYFKEKYIHAVSGIQNHFAVVA